MQRQAWVIRAVLIDRRLLRVTRPGYSVHGKLAKRLPLKIPCLGYLRISCHLYLILQVLGHSSVTSRSVINVCPN